MTFKTQRGEEILFTCLCYNTDHSLFFYKDEDYAGFQIGLTPFGFFRRIKIAFSYVFRPTRQLYHPYDEVLLNREDIRELRSALSQVLRVEEAA